MRPYIPLLAGAVIFLFVLELDVLVLTSLEIVMVGMPGNASDTSSGYTAG